MRKIITVLVSLWVCFFMQHIPANKNLIENQIIIECAFADEIQEMIEKSPEIIRHAYDGSWEKVISLAKQNKKRLKETDEMGNTVLHLAASGASDKVVVELLNLGADKNARDTTSQRDRPYDLARWNKNLSPKVRNMLR